MPMLPLLVPTPVTPATLPTVNASESASATAPPAVTAIVLIAFVAAFSVTAPVAVTATFLSPVMPPVPETPPSVFRCRLAAAGATAALMVIAPAVALPTSRFVTVRLPSSALDSSSVFAAASVRLPRSIAIAVPPVLGFTTALAAVTPAPTLILSATSVTLS